MTRLWRLSRTGQRAVDGARRRRTLKDDGRLRLADLLNPHSRCITAGRLSSERNSTEGTGASP